MTTEMPSPAFKLWWDGQQYKVDKPDVESMSVFTPNQMLAFYELGIKAGLEKAAKACEAEYNRCPYSDFDYAYNYGVEDCTKAIRALAEDVSL